MDLFRSWLYGREKPERFSSIMDKSNPEKLVLGAQEASREKMIDNLQHNENNQIMQTNLEPTKLEKLILKVVPLQPGDCLGCKLVGTSAMIASGFIVLTSAMVGRKRNPSLTGRKLTTYYIVCGSLFIGFQSAAVCRFFDFGPFGYLTKLQNQDNR